MHKMTPAHPRGTVMQKMETTYVSIIMGLFIFVVHSHSEILCFEKKNEAQLCVLMWNDLQDILFSEKPGYYKVYMPLLCERYMHILI